MTKPRAIIIGGGLAGMIVAKELTKHGFQAEILDAEDRLGGKAGADVNTKNPKRLEDHGYHVFPAWYVNTLALLKELDTHQNLIHFDRFHYFKTKTREMFTIHEFSGIRNVWQNLRSGLASFWQLLLTFYFVLDLGSERFSQRRYLDRVSANGFFRSRWYRNDGTAQVLQQSVLQASSIPNYEVSAMTIQNVARAWGNKPSPIYSILNGNLQTKFIKPFEDLIRSTGVKITLDTKLERLGVAGTRVSELILEGKDPKAVGGNDIVVLATPPEVTKKFCTDDVYEAETVNESVFEDELFTARLSQRQLLEPRTRETVERLFAKKPFLLPDNFTVSLEARTPKKGEWIVRDADGRGVYELGLRGRDLTVRNARERSLSDLSQLETAPMAGFTLYLDRKITRLPPEHVILFRSKYLLSFIDIAQHWTEELDAEKSTLSIIASDFEGLQYLSDEVVQRKIVGELERYIPELEEAKVEDWFPHPNVDTPLFLNTVGSWHFRPGTKTRLDNLYIAGDYCRSDADLTTMESVVISGMRTAKRILDDQKIKHDVSVIRLERFPRWRWKLYKWLLLPFAAVARIFSR